jgi:hypothetical protein
VDQRYLKIYILRWNKEYQSILREISQLIFLYVYCSYAALQKPPASLKPKLQSRTILNSGGGRLDGGNDDHSLKNSYEDNEGEHEEWKKW